MLLERWGKNITALRYGYLNGKQSHINSESNQAAARLPRGPELYIIMLCNAYVSCYFCFMSGHGLVFLPFPISKLDPHDMSFQMALRAYLNYKIQNVFTIL